ncbi:helix-turn-helix domain-containing protein [Algoriphagus sp. AGSA1]|uniref:helix-turn-helix domain-containing protein n=1 Tax=unclassified Algoriphagus TaxID=2641541 RepID=UPI00177F2798|nr:MULTISPECIES: helix-turn-helix transcriptional regulator [unclassified Algoriphagus]MCE7057581.1 helix-turn-helix domain-containing protein [Algoriphagus sp. AGSA1]
MENVSEKLSFHKGRKVERVRKLRGLSQSELGDRLGGITKQAVSKLEQSENISDEKLQQIANALEVTLEGLKGLSEEKVLYNTINFYENSNVNASSINANVENINNPLKETIEVFEKQLEKLREEFIKIIREK